MRGVCVCGSNIPVPTSFASEFGKREAKPSSVIWPLMMWLYNQYLPPTEPFSNRHCLVFFALYRHLCWLLPNTGVASVQVKNWTRHVENWDCCLQITGLNPRNDENTERTEARAAQSWLWCVLFLILWIDVSAHTTVFGKENRHANRLRWLRRQLRASSVL